MRNFHITLALLGMLLTAVIVRGGEGPSLIIITKAGNSVVIRTENNTNGCRLEHSADLKSWLTLPTPAASIRLAWDASPSTNVHGYNIYWGPLTRTYTNHVTVGSNTLTAEITGLPRGVDFFYSATAFRGTNESAFCNELTNALPVVIPSRFTSEFFRMRKVNQ